MNSQLLYPPSFEAIDATDAFTQVQLQDRAKTANANADVTAISMIPLNVRLGLISTEPYVRVEILPVGQFLKIGNANYANFSPFHCPHFGRLPVFSVAKVEAMLCLKALIAEYATDETIKIHPFAISTTENFLRALPDRISPPEFSIEPDGCISLDWMESHNRLFSLSVGKSNRLACAWLDGTNSGHFVENFNGINVPARIIVGITAIVKT